MMRGVAASTRRKSAIYGVLRFECWRDWIPQFIGKLGAISSRWVEGWFEAHSRAEMQAKARGDVSCVGGEACTGGESVEV